MLKAKLNDTGTNDDLQYLQFECEYCDYKEKVEDTDQQEQCLIYRNDLKGGKEERIYDTNLIFDPTLSRRRG
jgi:hypothetical protein